MGAGTVALIGLSFPFAPLFVLLTDHHFPDSARLLGGIVVQDGAYLATALAFARLKAPPRGWQLGLRRVPFWRTLGIAALGALVAVGFELGYITLLGIDEGNTQGLRATQGFGAALALCLAVIVVAPVTEELFFRAFFYRALRNRLRIWSAALIDGVVFGALHIESFNALDVLPVIGVFGLISCLVYEATKTIFASIAIHAAFNTLATTGTEAGVVVPLVVGAVVVLGCVVVPRLLPPSPSPFPPVRR